MTTETRSQPSPTALRFPVPMPPLSLNAAPGFARTMRFMEALADTSAAPVGQTPKDVVWSFNKAKLYRYRAQTATQYPVPLLIVHSLISRSYILDLIPGNSFIEFLVQQGFDVYLTDWGVPTDEDKDLQLEDYILGYLPRMVEAVQRHSQAADVTMFGYCMGGLLTLLYAAMHPDGPVRNVVSLATPVDFDQMGLQGIWSKQMDADRLVATYGNIPAELIKNSFRMLKPASEFSPVRFIGLWQNVESDKFIEQFRAFDRWTNEHIPFPGACFRQTMTDLSQQNKLIRGGMALDGESVSLAHIRQSFLAIAAEGDHIVPLAATRMQCDLVGSEDKQLITLPGGHVGLAAGRNAKKVLWPKVAAWLAERSA